MKSIFQNNYEYVKPLSLKMRPQNLNGFVGQEKILGEKGILKKLISSKNLSNCIFYGPPGVGKTTLGEIIANELDCEFKTLNATTSGVGDLKEIVENAKKNLEFYGRKTILFLDEIHRFNKLQQDSLLSSTESGVITLIGATTENPYYNLNNALISRVLIFEFKSLNEKDIRKILERGKKYLELENFPKEIEDSIVELSGGDSRVALNYLELYNNCKDLETEEVIKIFSERKRAFNKKEDKYNLISAMIKSIRGSDPNSAVYWMGRLISGGEDPRYIARRFIISAAEDIGLANPEALNIASSALVASERIGMPEIRIILSEVAIYLAISSKSPSAYNAINSALQDIEKGDCEEVPENINANPIGYKYPHDYPGSFVNQKYSNKKREYYIPAENRNEKMIKEKLEKLWNR